MGHRRPVQPIGPPIAGDAARRRPVTQRRPGGRPAAPRRASSTTSTTVSRVADARSRTATPCGSSTTTGSCCPVPRSPSTTPRRVPRSRRRRRPAVATWPSAPTAAPRPPASTGPASTPSMVGRCSPTSSTRPRMAADRRLRRPRGQRRRPPAVGRRLRRRHHDVRSATARAGDTVATTAVTTFGTMQPDGRVLLADTAAETATIVDPVSGATSAAFPGPVRAELAPVRRAVARRSVRGLRQLRRARDRRRHRAPASVAQPRRPAASSTPATSSRRASIVLGASFSNDDRWLVAASLERRSGRVGHHHVAPRRRPRAGHRRRQRCGQAGVRSDRALPRRQPRPHEHRPLRRHHARRRCGRSPPASRACPTTLRSIPPGATLAVVMDTVGVLTYDVESGERRWAAAPRRHLHRRSCSSTRRRSPSPSRRASGSSSGTSTTTACETEACRAAGRNLTRAEWDRARARPTSRTAGPARSSASRPTTRRSPSNSRPPHPGPDRLTARRAPIVLGIADECSGPALWPRHRRCRRIAIVDEHVRCVDPSSRESVMPRPHTTAVHPSPSLRSPRPSASPSPAASCRSAPAAAEAAGVAHRRRRRRRVDPGRPRRRRSPARRSSSRRCPRRAADDLDGRHHADRRPHPPRPPADRRDQHVQRAGRHRSPSTARRPRPGSASTATASSSPRSRREHRKFMSVGRRVRDVHDRRLPGRGVQRRRTSPFVGAADARLDGNTPRRR